MKIYSSLPAAEDFVYVPDRAIPFRVVFLKEPFEVSLCRVLQVDWQLRAWSDCQHDAPDVAPPAVGRERRLHRLQNQLQRSGLSSSPSLTVQRFETLITDGHQDDSSLCSFLFFSFPGLFLKKLTKRAAAILESLCTASARDRASLTATCYASNASSDSSSSAKEAFPARITISGQQTSPSVFVSPAHYLMVITHSQ